MKNYLLMPCKAERSGSHWVCLFPAGRPIRCLTWRCGVYGAWIPEPLDPGGREVHGHRSTPLARPRRAARVRSYVVHPAGDLAPLAMAVYRYLKAIS